MKYLLGLHKGQTQLSTNFQNIDILQLSVTMFVSVSLIAVDKHNVMIMTAINGDLKCTCKTLDSDIIYHHVTN